MKRPLNKAQMFPRLDFDLPFIYNEVIKKTKLEKYMQSKELITILSKYIKKTVLSSSHIKIENGISLLLPYSPMKPNGVYLCHMKTFQAMIGLETLPSSSTFLIVDCMEEPTEVIKDNDCSYFFLTCTLDEVSLILLDVFEEKEMLIAQNNYAKMQSIWSHLISISGNTDEILATIKEFYYPFRKFVACIVIISKQGQTQISRNDMFLLLEELNNFFPETNIFPYKNQIIILYSQDSRPINNLSFSHDAFSMIIEKYNMDAGISNACRHPNMYPTLYHTSYSSLELSTKITSLHVTKNIYQYEEYSTFYIIHLCVKEFIRIHGHSYIIYLVSPFIIELYRYDLKHNADLLTTLFHYLLNGCNVTITSKALYMHRNTVSNRLKKINSIATLPLDNGRTQFKLLMSCFIVTYYREYLEGVISK
ncbi:MAG TPA: PucR family transcriptional regulator [Epulopiscium sp.]|nr:PucR family transcriptional regulator [Candidatus Epulonipiscium sp.]